ncbi:MAG: trypsin-like peptidase domain-containing protein [Planctomycetales bacterium]|nr:trypsin-like peptidase domain-containing protein [Planctomycetales bacterium]
MSFSVPCGQCGKVLKIAQPFGSDPVACPVCGYVFVPQPPEEEVVEVGEADVVESDDANMDVATVDVVATVVTSDLEGVAVAESLPPIPAGVSKDVHHKGAITPLIAACAGAVATLLLVAIAGLGWWAISRAGSTQSEQVESDLGATESTELPWEVADANRHLRHNMEPIALASKASEPIEKPNASTVQTFRRKATEAEVRAKFEDGKDRSTDSSPTSDNSSGQDLARVIEEIKSATVFIQVETSEGVQSGSGFLYQRNNNWGMIVTNVHVVEPEEGKLEKITCVFHSGTSSEFEVAAQVACKDKRSDLAFLKAYDKKIPAPIRPAKDATVFETSTVLAAGFPFGDVLKTNRRNPSLTITKGTVSSLRLDDYDAVSVLQIDGGINPGNSGGPVVLEDGRLVGVAVAKVRGTSIGFAIPAQILQQTALGRVTRISVKQTDQVGNRHQFNIRFADPSSLIRSGELIVFHRSDQTVDHPESDGSWRPAAEKLLVAEPLRVERRRDDGESSATLELEIPSIDDLMFQVRIGRRDGGEHWSQPNTFPNSLELGVTKVIPLSGKKDEPEIAGKKNSEPTLAALPAVMTDFALNPSTGDIACLDPINNEIYLIPMDGLKAGNYSSSPKREVGKGPVALTYKRFQEHEYFVVACSQESELYLVTATSLEIVNKIPIGGNRVSRVVASTNQDDPFVYYTYGTGDDSHTGAIDLREMTDCGNVIDDSVDCTLSADGRFAYRRSFRSPLVLESLRMISEFSAPAPVFLPYFGDRRLTGECVPDPYGQITALGANLYSVGLDQHLSTMDFYPLCFFRSRPITVGLVGQRDPVRSLSMRAASVNTFLSTTSTYELPTAMVYLWNTSRTNSQRKPNASQFVFGAKVFADDLNQQVIYASNDKILLIPLDVFALRDDEPLMKLTSTSADFEVGKEKVVELRTANADMSIEVGEMPTGMKQVVGGLSWRPAVEQVGTTTIPITLRFDDIERVANFHVHVRQPSIQTSIDVADFVVDPNLAFCVCWSGRSDNTKLLSDPTGNNVEKGVELCVIPLDEKSESIGKELSFDIKQATLIGNRVALLPAGEDQQVHVLDLGTLDRAKLLLASFPVKAIEVRGDEFFLLGEKNVDVYSAETLKRLRTRDDVDVSTRPQKPSQQVWVDGMLSEGVLRGSSDSDRMLIVAPGEVPEIPGSQQNLMDGRFLRQVSSADRSRFDRSGQISSSLIVAGPIAIEGKNIQVSLENRIYDVQVPNIDLQQTEQRVTLLVAKDDGSVTAKVPIFRERVITGVPASRPVMRVAGDKVLVGCGTRIYHWSPSSIDLGTKQDSDPEELHFLPKQSAFTATEPKTLLNHKVSGGRPPYDLHLMTRSSGVEMNDQTGDVTLSRDDLIRAAASVLASSVDGMNADNLALELTHRSEELGETFERLTGHMLKGFPIAVPIHLKASDRDGTVAEIQYFVLIDIPIDDAVTVIQSRQ